MPYIPPEVKERLDQRDDTMYCSGELNYRLTQLALIYVEYRGLNYATINDVVGAFECAKAEFIRRVVAPYEDAKILANGDVYPLSMT